VDLGGQFYEESIEEFSRESMEDSTKELQVDPHGLMRGLHGKPCGGGLVKIQGKIPWFYSFYL